VFLPCLALIALEQPHAEAQTLTSDLLRRCATVLCRRRICPRAGPAPIPRIHPDDRSNSADNRLRNPDAPAPSRIGNIPTYGLPAASGASSSGYDSLNRKRQKAKLYPGSRSQRWSPGNRRPPGKAPIQDCRAETAAAASATANKTPIPPAMAGTVPGQPYRSGSRSTTIRSARSAIMPAVPGQTRSSSWAATTPIRPHLREKGSPFYVVAPEVLVVSDWERHAVVADLRGSYTGYTNTFPPENGVVSSAPTDVTGRISSAMSTAASMSPTTPSARASAAACHHRQSRQSEHSAGLAKYPLYAAFAALRIDQNFNRLQVSGGATIDRGRVPELAFDRRPLQQ